MKLAGRESIPRVVNSMTLEDKAKLLTGVTFFHSAALKDYGIPEVYYLDGGTGANFIQMAMEAIAKLHPFDNGVGGMLCSEIMEKMAKIMKVMVDPSQLEKADDETKKNVAEVRRMLFTEYMPDGQLPGCFPPGIVLASTWDPEVIYQCGRALGNETRFFGIDVLLGTPNVNLHRNPLNGRLFEGYSEDPYLVTTLAPAFVQGIQDEGIIANVKHFAANNQETNRTRINEKISERALRELYLPGFRACVQEGGCKTVMSAYNSINGKPCAHNDWLLRDVLKGEWGFEGFVVSDWGAVYDQVEGIHGGTDMDMPGMRSTQPLVDAVRAGKLDEKLIDEAISRVLGVLVDMPKAGRSRIPQVNRQASAKAAYDVAKEAFILLKNENKTLPLGKDAYVSLFGNASKKFIESGEGSANVVTNESTSLLDTLTEELGKDHVSFEQIHQETDTVIITASLSSGEGTDRQTMHFGEKVRTMLREILSQAKALDKHTVVILNICGPVDLREFIDQIDALLCVFLPGMEGGRAAADMLCGDLNPCGKLPLTFGKKYEDYGSSTNFPGWGMEVLYAEDIYVGYRHFDRWDIEPLYPFGFGLSYTQFSFDNARLSKATLDVDDGEEIILSVDLTNTGSLPGKEVLQVYVNQEKPTRPKPPRQLKAFKKVELMPGETKTIQFPITRKMFEEYDELAHMWVVEPGKFFLLVGNSSRNLPLSVELNTLGKNPYEKSVLANPLAIFNTPED